MHILYLDHYAGSPRMGMEYRPYYLAREWQKQGDQVTIIGGSYSHLRSENPKITRQLQETSEDGIRYLWVKTSCYQGNGFSRARTMRQYVLTLILNTRKIVRRCAPDVVIASSTYPLDTFAAQRIARRAKARLVHEIHDMWPATLTDIGGMSRRNPFVKIMTIAERSFCKHSDVVVSILPLTKPYLTEKGMADSKWHYVPNGIVPLDWQHLDRVEIPPEHREILEKLKSEGRFIVGYAGGHNISNPLDLLIRAAVALKAYPISFVFVGQGANKDAFIRQRDTLGLKSVYFLPSVTKAQVYRLLIFFDIAYVGWHKRDLFKFGISANKIFDYMMAGLPVLESYEYEHDIIRMANAGIATSMTDPAVIARDILKLYNMSEKERRTLGENGRRYVLENHTYKVLSKRFKEAMACAPDSRRDGEKDENCDSGRRAPAVH